MQPLNKDCLKIRIFKEITVIIIFDRFMVSRHYELIESAIAPLHQAVWMF